MEKLVLAAGYYEGISTFTPHFHDCHQIIYVTDGKVTVTVGRRTYEAVSGSLILISRFERHSVTVTGNVYKRYRLRINPRLPLYEDGSDNLFSILTDRPESFCHVVPVNEIGEITETLLRRITGEISSDNPYVADLTNMLLRTLLIELYRYRSDIFTAVKDDRNLTVIRDIQRSFVTDFSECYTMDDLSKKYNISVYYLSHLFKSVTGDAVMKHLTKCRLAAAKRMLIKSDNDIGIISSNCGFSDSSNFSRLFKRETGVTPTAFRKSNQK